MVSMPCLLPYTTSVKYRSPIMTSFDGEHLRTMQSLLMHTLVGKCSSTAEIEIQRRSKAHVPPALSQEVYEVRERNVDVKAFNQSMKDAFPAGWLGSKPCIQENKRATGM